MTAGRDERYTIRFSLEALTRCFLVAEVLRERFGQPALEYALLGFARASDPWLVVATPLLEGQSVASCHFETTGANMLKMRSEIAALGRRFGERLVPTCFCHRHPDAGVAPSDIDLCFATTVLVNQVAAVHTFCERQVVSPDLHADVVVPQGNFCPLRDGRERPEAKDVECAVAFSLIVSATGQFFVFSIRRAWCPYCGVPTTNVRPAALQQHPDRELSRTQFARLKCEIEREIGCKIRLPCSSAKRDAGT